MTLYIAPIVEGQTEQGCIEKLLHRIWHELLSRPERLQVLEPFRGHRDQILATNGKSLTDCVQKAFLKLKANLKKDSEANNLILILLDAEGDCPTTLGPLLQKNAQSTVPKQFPVSCVLAKRMFENWIVAGASTLGGVNGLPNPLPFRDQFEDRNGVNWIDAQFRSVNKNRKYKKTVDAEEFVAKMNLQECRNNSPSFDKLCRELEACFLNISEASEPTDDVDSPPSAPENPV